MNFVLERATAEVKQSKSPDSPEVQSTELIASDTASAVSPREVKIPKSTISK